MRELRFVKITVDQFVILTFAFLRVRSIRTPRVITSPRTGWRALFVKVEMWGQKDKVQPMVEKLKKGSLVAVTGDLGMKSHEYNGQTYTNVSMMAYKVEPLVKG